MWSSDTLLRNAPVLVPLVVAVVWELLVPRVPRVMRLARWPSNLTVGCVNAVLARGSIVLLAALAGGEDSRGLLAQAALPPAMTLLVSLLLLDGLAYLRHRALHAVPLLWRVHRVHHADLELDFTSAFRFHPLEALLVVLTSWAAIVGLGLSISTVLIYEALGSIVSILTHVNARLPRRGDAALRWLVVTPDMHRVHHADRLPHADTNFGIVFTLWDRALGTYHPPVAESGELSVGLVDARDPRHLALPATLAMPFVRDA